MFVTVIIPVRKKYKLQTFVTECNKYVNIDFDVLFQIQFIFFFHKWRRYQVKICDINNLLK